nr:helix-turn-helix domain-containing protein [Pseudarthrobacter sulfonivorans]
MLDTLVTANVSLVPDLLETAAEPNRRRLLQLLARGEQSVTELAANFAVSRSAISQHLLVLADVGLVRARKDGRNRYYSLDSGGMRSLRESLDIFWTDELDSLVAEATALQHPHLEENPDDH